MEKKHVNVSDDGKDENREDLINYRKRKRKEKTQINRWRHLGSQINHKFLCGDFLDEVEMIFWKFVGGKDKYSQFLQ